MKIINFYQNLQDREKKLLFVSFILIILLILYFMFSSLYKNYDRSSLNLEKAKSDYDYVFNKVRSFQNSYDKKVLDESIIENLLLKNNLEGKIDNLKISSVDALIYVSFSSSSINDAVSVSEKLINGSLNEISSIKYQRSNNKINTQLIFN